LIHLTLLRHGQASMGSDNYDQLSQLGKEQARKLGVYWATHGICFDQVIRGPLVRHQQTLAALIQGYACEGQSLPQAQMLEALTEHQAVEVMQRSINQEKWDEIGSDFSQKQTRRAYFEQFDQTMRQWVNQELVFDNLESWQQARIRVSESLKPYSAEQTKGQRVLMVTSGGFLAMAVGSILNLSDEKVYDLSTEIANTAYVELRFSRGRAFLVRFNYLPHLIENKQITLV